MGYHRPGWRSGLRLEEKQGTGRVEKVTCGLGQGRWRPQVGWHAPTGAEESWRARGGTGGGHTSIRAQERVEWVHRVSAECRGLAAGAVRKDLGSHFPAVVLRVGPPDHQQLHPGVLGMQVPGLRPRPAESDDWRAQAI